MKKEIEKESLEYLQGHMTVTDEITNKILNHCKRYNLEPEICAYYSDWEDSSTVGYTRTEARELYHGGKGEFLTFNSGDIIRFVM